MRRVMPLAVIVVLVSAPHAQQAALPGTVRAMADRITAAQLARDLAFLASDDLRGRNTPSPGFDRAADYVAGRLAAAGVKPLGGNGTFFQRYEMHESRVDTATTSLQVDGKKFAFGSDVVVRSFARPVSGPLYAVYVGHGWSIPDKGIDPYAGVDPKGKLVIAHGPRALPKGVEVRQIGRVTPGASSVVTEAARRGAAGVIFIPEGGALANWARWTTQNLSRKELVPGVPSAYAAPPSTAVLVSRAAADALFSGERVPAADLLAGGDAGDYPPSFQLAKQITLTVTAATTVHRPYNVVGLIEGSDPVLKTEYITVQSHLDGAVGTRTVGGDAIYNSADDNASGSAANLAIAELMAAAPRPKRSLIFIWDSGEEQGLWGTRHFVGHPPVPLDRVAALVNIDMIGATRAPGSPDAEAPRVTGPNEVFLIGPGVLSAGADALLESVNQAYLKMTFNRSWDTPDSEFFYPRTDAGPFLERGVLTIGFTTGIHDRYHLPADEARALDPAKMETIARTIFASVWALADSAERPRIDQAIPHTVPRY
ncbi:MAG TPA: M28 family peptidase [Vicinamibacterales bacterium]|nr:M28 family peptidase [Vicinamibacterales bacterium]